MEQIPDLTSDISRYHHTSWALPRVSPSGSRKMFPAWSRTHTHATPQWRRPHGFRPCGQSPANMFPSALFQSAIASPQFACAAHIAVPYSSVRVEVLASGRDLHDRCANFGRGLDSALQTGKNPCLGCCLYKVHGTKSQRSAERGRGTPIVPNPHRRAEVFGALLEIAFRAVASQRRIVLGCQA